MKRRTALVLLSALCAVPTAAIAQEGNARLRPLVEIVARLEREGYGPFTEIEFKRKRWEIEVYKDGNAYELVVDPSTGQTIAQRRDAGDPQPPTNAKKLSEILQRLEAQGYRRIRDVEFKRTRWEIEASRNGSRRELHVHPITGNVESDREDE